MISICGPVDEFDPEGYLYLNPDVADHPHETSDSEWATWHFEHYGKAENRLQLRGDRLDALAVPHHKKMERLFEASPGSRAKTRGAHLRVLLIDLGHRHCPR